jgi:PAS domain S-box-containing protein
MPMLLELIHNLAVLLVLSILYALVSRYFPHKRLAGKIVNGLLFGLVAIVGMSIPYTFATGIVFDGRSVIISIAALMGGPVTAAISAGIAIIYGVWMGGAGALTGSLVIASSAIVGLLFHHLHGSNRCRMNVWSITLMGFIVHVLMLLLVFTLPAGIGISVIIKMAPVMLVLFTFATTLLGLLLLDQQRLSENLGHLIESRIRYKTLFDNQPTIIWEEDFSSVKMRIDQLRNGGVDDFMEYFNNHPDEVRELAGLIRVKEVNSTTIEKMEAGSMDELLRNIFSVFDFEESFETFKETIIAIAGGKLHFESEVHARTLKGRRMDLYLRLVVPPNHKDDLKQVLLTFLDITELKYSFSRLHQSEEKYRHLFNNAEVGMFRTRLDGSEILEFNKKFLEILDYTDEEVRGMPSVNMWATSHDRDRMVKLLKKKEQVTSFECDLLNKRGGVVHCITSLRLYPENGILEGSIMDITKRKEAEEALRESEELFRKVFEEGPLGMLMSTGIEERFHSANAACCRMLGYTKKQLTNLSLMEITHPDDRADLVKANRRRLEGKVPYYRSEKRYLKKSGEIIWGLVTVVVIRSSRGNVVHLLMMIANITDYRQALDKLHENEEKLKLNEYNLKERAKELNGLCSMGLLAEKTENLEELYTEFVNIIVPQSMQFPERAYVLLEIGDRKYSNIENFRPPKSGKYLVAPLVTFGKQTGKLTVGYTDDLPFSDFFEQQVLGSFADRISKIIEGKELQESLATVNRRLEEIREQERSVLARELHDQLGQALTALQFDISWLLRKTAGGSEEIAKLQEMAELTYATIKDVQRLSSELRPAILDDIGLGAAMEWYINEFGKRTGIECHIKMDDVQFPDKKRHLVFYRILQEALTNVARHASAGKVSVNLFQSDDFVILEVHDDGTGFEVEKIDPSKSLGLLGMQERLKPYNGNMDISSTLNRGTKLSVTIPLR